MLLSVTNSDNWMAMVFWDESHLDSSDRFGQYFCQCSFDTSGLVPDNDTERTCWRPIELPESVQHVRVIQGVCVEALVGIVQPDGLHGPLRLPPFHVSVLAKVLGGFWV